MRHLPAAGIDPLAGLVGAALSSVEFAEESYRLHFKAEAGASSLEVFNPSRVVLAGAEYVAGEAGFRDALCDLIGHAVRTALFDPKVELKFSFDGSAQVAVSLKPTDFAGDSGAHLKGRDGSYTTWHEDGLTRLTLHGGK